MELPLKLKKALYGPGPTGIKYIRSALGVGVWVRFFDRSAFYGFGSSTEKWRDGADRPYLAPPGPISNFFRKSARSGIAAQIQKIALSSRPALDTAARPWKYFFWTNRRSGKLALKLKKRPTGMICVFSPDRTRKAIFWGIGVQANCLVNSKKVLCGPEWD